MDQIRNLNVGGKFYTTSLSTLTKYPDSMLGRMFSGDLPSTKDSQGNFLIDRDGELFRYILTFLRSSKPVLPEDFKEMEMLKEEAEFYQIEELLLALEECKEQKREQNKGPSKDVFMLNVGGTIYPVLRKYLEPTKSTVQCNQLFGYLRRGAECSLVLGNLWQTISDPDAPKDENGYYIIPCDGTLFRFILTLVHTKRFNLPRGFDEFKQLQAEMNDLGMQTC